MRKFTVLFLLAFAMTIGAGQAYAQSNNDTASIGRIDRPDRPGRPDDGPEEEASDKSDPVSPILRRVDCLIRTAVVDCGPPKKKKKKVAEVEKDREDCSCVHKVMRVNGRSMPFIDCYKSIEVNGRNQVRYCTRDDES